MLNFHKNSFFESIKNLLKNDKISEKTLKNLC